MRHAALATLALLAASCGYVGEPLPPLLHIPEPVTDLTAWQRGGRVLLSFSAPKLNTEGTAIRKAARIELRGAPAPDGAWNPDVWSSGALPIEATVDEKGRVSASAPIANWVGREVVFGVRTVGQSGRASAWSNLVTLQIVPALPTPGSVAVAAVAEGVRVTWSGSAPKYRVLRHAGAEETAALVTQPEYLDKTTAYGRSYRYSIQALAPAGNAEAESERSPEKEITPQDTFAPAVPAGVAAVVGASGIELAWEPNTESDLAGYRVHRALGDGAFEPLAGPLESPSYSDKKVESGKRYRYTVTSVDKLGNQSKPSEPAEAIAP